MKKDKILSAVIIAVLLAVSVASFIPNGGHGTDLSKEPLGGTPLEDQTETGADEANALIVYTPEDLVWLAQQVNSSTAYSDKYYILDDDIDLSVYNSSNTSFNGGKGWIPIGNYDHPFSGVFDGNGNVITGLYTNIADYDIGLFGAVIGGTVKNLGLTGTEVKGASYTGGITGGVYDGGAIENCYLTGTVTGSGGIIGGIAGTSEGGTITNCYFIGSVSGTTSVGGIAGASDGGTITNCYSSGTVTGSGNVGGIAGSVSNSSIIENCAALTQSISGSSSGTGRIAGTLTGSSISDSVAWDEMNVNGSPVVAPATKDGTDATTADINGAGFFEDLFGNDTAWTYGPEKLPGLFGERVSMPVYLRTGTPLEYQTATGADEANALVIYTPEDLAYLADRVNDGDTNYNDKYYVLNNDIDLSVYNASNTSFNGGKGWIPIGHGSSMYSFSGTFDGDGNVITGLYTLYTTTADSHIGLFGMTTGGTIKNLGLTGTVTSSGSGVGGIVGIDYGGTITNCYFIGSVSGIGAVGGIVGNASIVGLTGATTVTNCYFIGSVTGSGSGNVGGIVGSGGGTITNCYSLGTVTGSGSGVGGIVGPSGAGSSIENCAALTQSISGSSSSSGRVVGSLSSSASISNSVAWDEMLVNGLQIGTPAPEQGTDATAADINGAGFFETLFGNDTAWTYGPEKLPGLFGETVDMPAYLIPVENTDVATGYGTVIGGNSYTFTLHGDHTATLTGSGTLTGEVELPSEVEYGGETYTVTKIGPGSLAGKGFTKLTIPGTVTDILPGTSISTGAISECTDLTEVVLPAGLETIGGYAFYECTDLTEVVLPAGTQLETIGGYAFYGCTALRLMTIPVGVTSVGSYAFYECGSLEGTISLDSAAIGQRAFWNCVSLYYLDMRAGTIDNYAFRGCTELVSVILGPDVTSVGQSAFSQCTSIEFLWLGPNMTTMGVLAFSNLNLQTIIFECDASLSTIAANAISRGTMYVPFDYSKDLSKFSSKLTVERFIVTDEGNLLLISGSGFEKEIGDCTDGPQLIFRVTDPDYDKDSLRVLVSGASFELIDEGSGNYVLNITEEKESIMSVTVSVEYFICTVSSTGDFFTLAEISGSKRYSSTYSFEIIVGPMYDASGMTVTANGSPIVPYYDNRYSITLTGDTVISVTGIVPVSSFEVTFDNGVSVFPVTVTAGTPVPDSTIPAFGPDNGVAFDGWYTDADMINRFDIGSPITSDMTLYGGWTADRYTVTMSTAHGTIIAYSPTGTEIVSGMSVPAGTVLKLKAVMNYGYEVIYWNVNGKVMYGSDTFVISLNGDTDVTVGLRYYSTGYSYTVDTETILPDDYEKYWFWGQEIDPLAGDLTSYYTAMPRGSLIVGDYLYLRSYFTFYKVSIYDGTLFGKMEVTDLTTGFQYANGLFMTTGKAYDLDLNYVADVPNGIRYLIYTDGAYYGFGDTTAVKFTVDREAGTSQVEWTVSYSRYVPDDYGGLAYGDGYFFIIEASASSPDRKITSFSMATGAKIDTITLDKVAGHLLDDGWLTYYDGYVYLTTYTSGLFGSTNPIKGSIVKVELLPDGKFDRNTVSYTSTGTEKHSSGFIVYNGRGYVNANDELQVYNVDTMELIYSVKGQYTHGGMVLNTGYATAENDYTVYLYVIPYAASSEIVVFEDKQGQTEGIMMTLESAGVGQYATTAIRSGQNGELVWYNDSSVLFIYGKHIEEKEYNFFVNDGTTAGWITLTGPTPGEALLKMYGMSVSSVSGNVTYNGTLMNVAYLANVNFAGTAYEGWNVPTDGILDEAHQYHRYWMISVTDVNDGWYSAADGRTYSEIDSIGTSAFGMPFVSVGGPYTPAPLTFVNDGYDLPAGTAGVAIDGVTVYGGVSGGKLPYAFAASGLPEGLLIDAYSGTIYGTPISFSTAGKATILVTDGMGTIAYITISFGEIEPIAYTLSEGGTVGWTKGAPNGLTVTSNGELSKFIGVKVDNVLIGASDYDVTEGSTVVTFKPSYLSTLSNGNHVVELIFSDGSAFTSLSVSAASTGDGNGNGNGNGNGDGGNGNGSGNVNGNGSANANVSATDEGAVAIAAAVAILALAALAIFVLIRRP